MILERVVKKTWKLQPETKVMYIDANSCKCDLRFVSISLRMICLGKAPDNN